jgi:hypothetical protein
MRKRAEGLSKIVRGKLNCGVTGSRSSRKEEKTSEEEQEDLRNKKDSQISDLLLIRIWRSGRLPGP